MKRRRFLVTALAGSLAAVPLAVEAQRAGKVYRVGILNVAGAALVRSSPLPAFFQRLRDLGWVEGQNIAFERRVAFDAQQDLKVFAAEGRVPGLVEKRNGAFFRSLKCTTSRPPWRAATGGTRHGGRYQGARGSACA